jgi:hypothetical protein
MTTIEIPAQLDPGAYDKRDQLSPANWGQLREGERVIVQRDGGPLLTGKVDLVASDSVFWVWLDGGCGRIAVYADEGIRVWLPRV